MTISAPPQPNPSIRLSKKNAHRRLSLWLFFNTFLPVAIIVACWVMTIGVPYSFFKNFLSGDPLLLAAALCLGISGEIYNAETILSRNASRFADEKFAQNHFFLSIVIAVLLFILYTSFKNRSISYNFPKTTLNHFSEFGNVEPDIICKSLVSILFGSIAICYATFVMFRLCEIVKRAEITASRQR